MILGFFGKGGSGKSTLSTNFTNFLIQQKNKVLAIDADYNMDFSYNLGLKEDNFPYINSSLKDIKKYLNIKDEDHFSKCILEKKYKNFYLSPKDEFTEKYSKEISENLSLMIVGPHTDHVLSGASCSHSLFVSLKAYLPLLELKEDELVVVDHTAGADSAGTGISTGLDIAFIVVEPTIYSIKVANQIMSILDTFKTNYEVIINKSKSNKKEEESLLISNLSKKPLTIFNSSDDFLNDNKESLNELLSFVKKNQKNPSQRFENTYKKYKSMQDNKIV